MPTKNSTDISAKDLIFIDNEDEIDFLESLLEDDVISHDELISLQ